MNIKKIVIGAGLVMGSAVAAVAGGLADAIVEQDPAVVADVVEQSGGLPGWVIPVVVLGALALAAANSSEDDDGPSYGEE